MTNTLLVRRAAVLGAAAGKAFEDPGAVGDGDARPVVVDVQE